MIQTIFSTLVLRAIDEPGFMDEFLAHPDEVAAAMDLNRAEARELAEMGRPGFEELVGSLIAPKLIPIPITEQLLVAPCDYPTPIETDRQIVRIDQSLVGGGVDRDGVSLLPGRAFGSGSHPTTTLCLRALESKLKPGDSVLDLGTGSGVVAIAAAMLGASHVVACDVDPAAVAVAARHIALNHVGDRVEVIRNRPEALPELDTGTRFDLIVSNILYTIHQQNLKLGLVDLLRPSGTLILSGLDESQANTLGRNLARRGLSVEGVHRFGIWAALIASSA